MNAVDPVAEQMPLGGLERWLHDPTVDEVMVNGGREVWVDRHGTLSRVGTVRAATVHAALERLLAPVGRRVDRSHPMVDARLPDGSRLCAVVEPVAVDGPALAVRRFPDHCHGLDDFTTDEVADLLDLLVSRRCNVVVSGATSTGKTTLLNALAAAVDPGERIVTLEDVAELRLPHAHVLRLESRPPTPDGVGEVTLGHLLRTALRMRPDRLVVGEVRGEEAVHLLQALNTGHDGSLATVHANSADDALARLCALVQQHVTTWPLGAVQQHVARAIDAVVHLHRDADGRRRVHEVVEVVAAVAPDGGARMRTRCLALDGATVSRPERMRR